MYVRCSDCQCQAPAFPGERERRRLNRCPTVPSVEWSGDFRPPLGPPEHDYAAGAEICPGALARQDAAQEARRAYLWWETGQLALLYPGGLPAVVVEAVETYRAAKLTWEREHARLISLERARGERG